MRIGLFVTCLVDAMRPSIGFASVSLLEAAGCEVTIPDTQTCCGQPGFNSGDRESGTALGMAFLRDFEGFDAIVAPSGSCIGMIRDYPTLFKDDLALQSRLNVLTAKCYELTDFLVNHAPKPLSPGQLSMTVSYHDSCTGLRQLDVKAQPRFLLQQTQGVELREMKDAEICCGFGGSFSIKLGDIATQMADKKCAHALETGCDAIVGGDLGCLLNIEGRLRRRGDPHTQVKHVAELLAESLVNPQLEKS
jgi:L-lactate dehydrogenase complex protein LldE